MSHTHDAPADVVWPIVAAAVVAAAMLLALTGATNGTSAPPVAGVDEPGEAAGPEPVTGPDARSAFLDSFERSRLATFAADYRSVRTLDTGAVVESLTRIVQAPPSDRLVVGSDGTVRGRRADVAVVCVARARCQENGPLPPYAEEVAAEVDALAALTSGEVPRYEVARDGDGCFTLVLRAGADLDLNYGDEARFCFDDATGAPREIELHREGAVDRLVAVEIDAEVRPADTVFPAEAPFVA